MIESLINKALDGNLDLVKKILADLDIEFFSVEDKIKIKKIRDKFNVAPSNVKSLYVHGKPTFVWLGNNHAINTDHITMIREEISFQMHENLEVGQVNVGGHDYQWRNL